MSEIITTKENISPDSGSSFTVSEESKKENTYRYRWLKLQSSFMSNPKILYILKTFNPPFTYSTYDIVFLYLNLLLLGMSHLGSVDPSESIDGYFYEVPEITGDFYSDLSFAVNWPRNNEDLTSCMSILSNVKLLSYDVDSRLIVCTPSDDMVSIGSETAAAARMRKSRAKKKI